jgi:hypothetical protein
MSAYDPTDLMALCESILSDGELSGREVYRLAQWLNENRDAAQHWPGNLLVKLLQKAWSDGQITTAELQEIGRLLVKVHKEWIASHAGEVLDAVPAITPEILKKIDLTQPLLPSVPWVTRLRSRSEKGDGWEIDLSQPSCTCPEWRQERSQLPVGHLSRCCRHVLHAFSRLHPQPGWPGWMRAFLGHQWTPHPSKQWMVLRVRDLLVLASTAPVDWADVFAIEEGEYERFGYHVMENRWAYDSRPADSEYIRTRIITATRAMSPEAARGLRVRFVLPPPHHKTKALTR